MVGERGRPIGLRGHVKKVCLQLFWTPGEILRVLVSYVFMQALYVGSQEFRETLIFFDTGRSIALVFRRDAIV